MKGTSIGLIDQDLISLIEAARKNTTCNAMSIATSLNGHYWLELGNPELYWEAMYLWRKDKSVKGVYLKECKFLLKKDVTGLKDFFNKIMLLGYYLYRWAFFEKIATKNYMKYVAIPFKERTGLDKTF